MKTYTIVLTGVLGLVGCSSTWEVGETPAPDNEVATNTAAGSDVRTNDISQSPATQPNNTAINSRDRDEGAITAGSQGQSKGDVEITADIRREVMDSNMSAVVIGGLGTWLIAPAHTNTIGASGLVFGYATYLFARGVFDRSVLEILTGVIVGVVWGGALVASIVPHTGISWQAHVCGAVGGVVAAWWLAGRQRQQRSGSPPAGGPPPAHRELHESLDRALAE